MRSKELIKVLEEAGMPCTTRVVKLRECKDVEEWLKGVEEHRKKSEKVNMVFK